MPSGAVQMRGLNSAFAFNKPRVAKMGRSCRLNLQQTGSSWLYVHGYSAREAAGSRVRSAIVVQGKDCGNSGTKMVAVSQKVSQKGPE